MVYNSSMFGTKIFVVTLDYDVIGIQAMGSFEKCGRTVFKIVSPTDDFETTKMGLPWLPDCCSIFPVYVEQEKDMERN